MLKGSVRLLWNHNRRGGDYGSTDRLSDSLLPFPSNVHLPAAIRQWGNALCSRWSRCHVKRYIFGHGVGGRKAFAIGCSFSPSRMLAHLLSVSYNSWYRPYRPGWSSALPDSPKAVRQNRPVQSPNLRISINSPTSRLLSPVLPWSRSPIAPVAQ